MACISDLPLSLSLWLLCIQLDLMPIFQLASVISVLAGRRWAEAGALVVDGAGLGIFGLMSTLLSAVMGMRDVLPGS